MRKKQSNIIVALWKDEQGNIFGITDKGIPIRLCTNTEWNNGPKDSLRRRWHGNIRLGKKKAYQKLKDENGNIVGFLTQDWLEENQRADVNLVPKELYHLLQSNLK